MTTIKCEQCGKTFAAQTKWRRFCDECNRARRYACIANHRESQRQAAAKKFCRQCGAELGGRRFRFCSEKCRQKHRLSSEPHTIVYRFALFKNIVAASATAEEFNEYWKKYFREDSHDDD